MTRDEVIRLAREAEMGFDFTAPKVIEELQRFAALVAAAERKECAIACEGVEQATESQSWVVANCVEDILARGKV